jgi:hypothetical protein
VDESDDDSIHVKQLFLTLCFYWAKKTIGENGRPDPKMGATRVLRILGVQGINLDFAHLVV